jgi:histidinol-phosphate aminotransferase
VTTLGSYPTFEYDAAGTGAEFERVPYRDEAADLEALAATAERSRAKVLYLANPDNPSGSWHSPDSIQALRSILPDGCVLLLDEAYYEFAPASPPINVDDSQVIHLRTFSKAHGMAGARIAYTVSHPDHAHALNKIRYHFGVNCVAQAGALASLADPAHVRNVVAATAEGRVELAAFVTSLGFRPLPSHTNFLTVDVGSKARAEGILEALLQRGVFIRKPGKPPLDGCIRITIGRPEQREALCAELRAASTLG